MRNAKKKFGIAIYKEEKKEIFNEIFNEIWKKARTIRKPDIYIGHKRGKQGWVLFQITAKPFPTYKDFDNFLYELSGHLSENNVGMVLGHNDNDGFFWMDYPELTIKQFLKEESNLDEI